MYYVPSIQKEILFKELTIGQFKNIYKKTTNDINFNIEFYKTLISNCTEPINLTNFDKETLLLQIHLNEIKNKSIYKKEVLHPQKQNLIEGLYNIDIIVPCLKEETDYKEFITSLSKTDKNILLLAEITKHISKLSINNTAINLNIEFKDKINIIKKLTPNILSKCIQHIDSIKKQTKNYYSINGVNYCCNISLLIP